MTPENFCYWLQGWFELNQTIDHRDGATKETMEMISTHLALVFEKKTGPIPNDFLKALQEARRLHPKDDQLYC